MRVDLLAESIVRNALIAMVAGGTFASSFAASAESHRSGPELADQERESVIIGIHGLLNKPPKNTLETGWGDSIKEGLQRNHGLTGPVPVELVYWADILNEEPLSENEEPYVKAKGEGPLERYDPGTMDKVRAIASKYAGRWADVEKQLTGLGTNIESLIGIKFDDLAHYYDHQEIRENMRARLSDVLERHRGKSIMLIAHSMGSIIAYDVLRSYDDSDGLVIEHFLTIGSPLGLPIVAHNVREEYGSTRTPKVVRRWTNIADPGDKVALDCALDDEYEPNDGVKVRDVLSYNHYVSPAGEENNHKSYGYLRAPEVSERIKAFLAPGE